MTMREIVIPEDVELDYLPVQANGKCPLFSFADLTKKVFGNHHKTLESVDNLDMVMDFIAKTKQMKPGDKWPVSKTEHDLLDQMARSPGQISGDLKPCILPLLRAIMGAKRFEPKKDVSADDVQEKTQR